MRIYRKIRQIKEIVEYRRFALSPIYMAENFWHGSDEKVRVPKKLVRYG